MKSTLTVRDGEKEFTFVTYPGYIRVYVETGRKKLLVFDVTTPGGAEKIEAAFSFLRTTNGWDLP